MLEDIREDCSLILNGFKKSSGGLIKDCAIGGLVALVFIGFLNSFRNVSYSETSQEQDRQRVIQTQYDSIINTYDLDSNGVIDSSEVRRYLEQTFSR